MPIKNPKELFVALLSNVRQGTERTNTVYKEIIQAAQRPDVKEALEARVFISEDILARIDQCFKIIGEQPMKPSPRLQGLQETFADDFRKELAEIESPVARHLFILAKANHLMHLRIAEYVALIETADVTGHYAVGALLETCLADKLAFAERARRLIRHIVKTEVVEKLARAA
jgi:ferritin-like metal-binding protein YciE